MKRRILTLTLALLLMVGMLPLSALAIEETIDLASGTVVALKDCTSKKKGQSTRLDMYRVSAGSTISIDASSGLFNAIENLQVTPVAIDGDGDYLATGWAQEVWNGRKSAKFDYTVQEGDWLMDYRYADGLDTRHLYFLVRATSEGVAEAGARIAYASTQSVRIDDKVVELQAYALKDENGNDTNYVKIRDVADALDETAAQFNVGWDNAVNIETSKPYTTRNGQENRTPYSGNREYVDPIGETKVDGVVAPLDAFMLLDDNGGASTYYKLRDLGKVLNFNVGWANGGIFVETDKPYDPGN